jgi:hypothetical protein
MKFSERQGLVAVHKAVQTNSMSPELRASLWNVLHLHIWDRKGFRRQDGNPYFPGEIIGFAKKFWLNYFKRPFSLRLATFPHQRLTTTYGVVLN